MAQSPPIPRDAATGATWQTVSIASCAKELGCTPRRLLCLLPACALVIAPTRAEALDVSGGMSVGGILAGTKPRLALSPHAGVSWRMGSGFVLAIDDMFSILAGGKRGGLGVYNHSSALIGYATENTSLVIGPSFSIYSMPACNSRSLCGHVTGLAAGGQAQANVYFVGPLGASVSVNVDWIGRSSPVLPGGVAAMVVAGPVLRWTSRLGQ